MKRLIIICSLLATFQICQAFTLSELRSRARDTINDADTDAELQVWTDTQLNTLFTEAQEDLVDRTWCLITSTDIATNTDNYEYILSTECIIPVRVEYWTHTSTTHVRLKELDYMTIAELDRDSGYWQTATSGVPKGYYYRENRVGFYPPIKAAYAGARRAKVYYVRRPTPLSADSHVPLNGRSDLYSYHRTLIWYVAAICFDAVRDIPRRDMAWGKYLGDVESLRRKLKSRPDKEGGFKL